MAVNLSNIADELSEEFGISKAASRAYSAALFNKMLDKIISINNSNEGGNK